MTDGLPVRIGPRSDRRVPLTRTQAQIWTSQRLHPEAPLANMAYRIRLAGRLDPERLTRAFDTVVRATEALRMVVDDGAEPSARILAAPPRSTAVVDVPATEAEAWTHDRIERPIDATECVYDSVVLRHADDDWTWWLDLHHVATDAWSS
ncbi:condensation domain-containing protein, partial [Ilumatobacter sp.]|uniref:condensation domain-containing protein n=1 Tax=Ilumatobacter sp. TaxID=1967498 RepID=UPI003AF67805